MKIDEYQMLLGSLKEPLPPKRHKYILRKWEKWKWLVTGQLTDEFFRIKDLAVNKEKHIDKWDGRVVNVRFIQDRRGFPESTGILVDHGDNGWYLYTTGTCRHMMSYYCLGYHLEDIAYIDLHPYPNKIWERLNFLFWKHEKLVDGFHKKIHNHSYGSVCDYSRAAEGILTYSNTMGKIGECFSYCQCKYLVC